MNVFRCIVLKLDTKDTRLHVHQLQYNNLYHILYCNFYFNTNTSKQIFAQMYAWKSVFV